MACLAVAGPVKNNVVRFTNRSSDAWVIDGYVIAEQLGIRSVLLINDFLAVGYGILTLDEDKDCCVLQVIAKICSYGFLKIQFLFVFRKELRILLRLLHVLELGRA